MYLEFQYFKDEATDFVNRVGVDYSRVTSGYSKGEYIAKLHKPNSVPYEEYRKYMRDNYGDSEIPTYTKYSRADKDEVKKYLIDSIANYFNTKNYQNTPQYYSDLYKYFIKNKERRASDIYFSGEIGRSSVDFFSILNGTINNNNWENKNIYVGEIKSSFGFVSNFKELYYSLKDKAKIEWLENNNRYRTERGAKLDTFKFDEENIPAIKEFESRFNEVAKPIEKGTSIEILKNLNLSKLANTGNIKIGYRKEFLNGNIVLGRERKLIFPNDVEHKSYFAIVELGDIIASHNEVTFAISKGYPYDANGKSVNDRNYSAVMRLKKLLIECNIISENEVSAFFSDFSLTETGKILYETLLISIILNPIAIEISQNAGVKSATNAIVNAIIPLIKNKKSAAGSLVEEVNNALLIQNEMVSSNYKKLSEFITENTMFKEDASYKNEKAFIINWYLNQRVNDFKTAMLKYNNSIESNEGGSLFGDSLTPDEIFKTIFTDNVDSEIIKSIGTFNKHQEKIVVATTETQKETFSKKEKEKLILRLQKAAKYL